ncbi:MAG: hypothetical protein ACRDHO_08800 [Actinomycetota bacterium]
MSIQTTSPHPVSGPPRAGLRRPPRSQSVVAVILEDGTIRSLGTNPSHETKDKNGWASGSVSGSGWILWWDRRKVD